MPYLPLHNFLIFKSSKFHDWECPREFILFKPSGLPREMGSHILSQEHRWQLWDHVCSLVKILLGLTYFLLPQLSLRTQMSEHRQRNASSPGHYCTGSPQQTYSAASLLGWHFVNQFSPHFCLNACGWETNFTEGTTSRKSFEARAVHKCMAHSPHWPCEHLTAGPLPLGRLSCSLKPWLCRAGTKVST